MDDLQSLIDNLKLSKPVNGRQMDDLAVLLENKLGLCLDRSAYRQLAENMVNLSISKKQIDSNHFKVQHKSDEPHNDQQSSYFATSSSSFCPESESMCNHGFPSGDTHYDVIDSQQLQNHSRGSLVLSPNIKQKRGRSPARSNSRLASSRMSPIRNIFGGIPRAGVTLGSNSGNKSTNAQSSETGRSFSPSPASSFSTFFRRPAPRGNEDKRDADRLDDRGLPSVSTAPSFTTTPGTERSDPCISSYPRADQRTVGSKQKQEQVGSASIRADQSSGASPQRQHSRVSGTQKGLGRSHSPHNAQSFMNGQVIGPPSSPGLHTVSMRQSAPNSPVFHSSSSMPTEKAPSRSGSPFNRPGLQEYEQGDEALGRSPKRDQINNSSRHGVLQGHRRTRSNGVDTDPESSRQPQIPRSCSRSPLRRPSAAPEQDSDSIRQPAPPRSYSYSPRRDCQSTHNDETVEATTVDHVVPDIAMPDLSVPDFNPIATPSTRYQIPNNENVLDAERIHVKILPKSTHAKLKRKDGIPYNEASIKQAPTVLAPQPNKTEEDARFEIGTCTVQTSRGHRIPTKRSYRRADSRSDLQPDQGVTDSRNDSTPSPISGDVRKQSYSPMDIETPTAANVVPDGFCIGVVKPCPQRSGPHRRHPSLDSNEQEASESYTPKLHGSFSQDGTDTTAISSLPSVEPSYSSVSASINSKRDDARSSYLSGDYISSINSYTDAIKIASQHIDAIPSDTIALLLSNRAAALLMVGAYEASITDCQNALRKISTLRNYSEPLSADCGLLLKIKLYTRTGRAMLKIGDYQNAHKSFDDAVKTSEEALSFIRDHQNQEVVQQNHITLTQMITEATLGQTDAKRLRDSCEKLSKLSLQSLRYPIERSLLSSSETLNCVNVALSIATGSVSLSESKVIVLANMKRWREVVGFCERLAARNVRLENIFREDLTELNPFPGIPPASSLKSNFFDNARDEDTATRDLRLISKACGEAVLRLPPVLMPFYVRALRLEERYPAAEVAIRALEDLVHLSPGHFNYADSLSWVVKERSKLTRTKQFRERGDELFKTGDVDLAAAQYTMCLKVDAEGLPEMMGGSNAGGRLHAVLHCNKAACFMASKCYQAAMEECSFALKIHPRYMKAILRRARSHARLQQIQESIADYRRWLDLVEEAGKPNYSGALGSPCIFDGPSDVKAVEISVVKKELDEMYSVKRRAETASREEADRKREREKWMENFSSNWRPSSKDAQQRRNEWFDQPDDVRRWDSFHEETRSRSQSRSKTYSDGTSPSSKQQHNQQQHYQQSNQQQTSVSPRADSSRDHYAILQLSPNAKLEDIKKAFRKLAVKYHPDKNKEEGATENFLRIKLAHDTLSDPVKRLQYDADLRRRNRFQSWESNLFTHGV